MRISRRAWCGSALASRLWWLRFSTDQCPRTARVFSCTLRLVRKCRVWLFCFGSGSIFSDQSRWTVRAERAPGSPALMGDNGGHGSATPVQSPVLAFLAQCKKGVPARACVAAASRWAVLALVPMR